MLGPRSVPGRDAQGAHPRLIPRADGARAGRLRGRGRPPTHPGRGGRRLRPDRRVAGAQLRGPVHVVAADTGVCSVGNTHTRSQQRGHRHPHTPGRRPVRGEQSPAAGGARARGRGPQPGAMRVSQNPGHHVLTENKAGCRVQHATQGKLS